MPIETRKPWVVSSLGNDPSKIERYRCCFCEDARTVGGQPCQYCEGSGEVLIELLEIPCSCEGTGVQKVRRKL